MTSDPNLDLDDAAIPQWWFALPVEEQDRWITAYREGLDADLAGTLDPRHHPDGRDPWVGADDDGSGRAMEPKLRDFVFWQGYEAAADRDDTQYWIEEAARLRVTTDTPLHAGPDNSSGQPD